MKYNELFKKLKKAGWEIVREGGNHTIYEKDGKQIVVPRHPSKEVPTGTCNAILKQAGLK